MPDRTAEDSPTEGSPTDDSTVCPRCGVGCRLAPGPEESRAGSEESPSDPARHGSRARGVAGGANPNARLCRKGVGAFDAPDDRLTTPLVRQDGDLRPVSWASASEQVVESFESILDEHGPDALGFLGAPHSTTEENYLLQKLARLLGTNNVDNRARHCHESSTRALADQVGWPATTNGLADLPEADVVVVAGANPAERQPIAFNSFVRPAVDAGTTLVHVDPVGNRTTRLADVHLTPRPGTDALVFDRLSARLLDRDTSVPGPFIEDRTRGFDRFAASLADVDDDEALLAAGVTAESIDRVADRLADADRVAGLVGTGIEGGPPDVNAAEALVNLLLLTGNFGRRGTGLFVLRGLVNEQGATDAGCAPDRLPGHRPVTDETARARVESEWGAGLPSTPGKTATELLASFGSDVRGALAVGENPAVSKRDPEWVGERLDSLDALVVVDVTTTETVEHADVVLPAATGTEKTGTVTNLERRVQRLERVQQPPESARTDVEILTDLGERLVDSSPALDASSAFDYADVSAVFEEFGRVAPTYAGASYDELGIEGEQWPFESDSDGGDGSDGVLYRETFETPDGRARFGSAQPLVEPDSGAGSDADSEADLWLVTGGRAGGAGSEDSSADARLRIDPADARERGIDADESVVVSRGDVSIRATADLDESVRDGAVYLSASVADPLLRQDGATVSVRPGSELDGGSS